MAKQYPVHTPWADSFGMVGAGAVDALLADVDLPAAEIGGGWFHGVGFSNAKIYTNQEHSANSFWKSSNERMTTYL